MLCEIHHQICSLYTQGFGDHMDGNEILLDKVGGAADVIWTNPFTTALI